VAGILAVDQGTTVGLAWALPGHEPGWEHKRMGKTGAWDGAVFWEFRNFLLHKIGLLSPDHLIYETPFLPRPDPKPGAPVQNFDVLLRGCGLVAHIVELAEEFNIDCKHYDSQQFTKFFTGKGRFSGETVAQRRQAKKQATIAACAARGWHVTNDEADALALLCFSEYQLYPREALSRRMVLKTPQGPLQSLLTTP
jgi:hypothetical protein